MIEENNQENKDLAPHPTKPGFLANGKFAPKNQLATGNNAMRKLAIEMRNNVAKNLTEQQKQKIAAWICEGFANRDEFVVKEFKEYFFGKPQNEYEEPQFQQAPIQVVINTATTPGVKIVEAKPSEPSNPTENNESESV